MEDLKNPAMILIVLAVLFSGYTQITTGKPLLREFEDTRKLELQGENTVILLDRERDTYALRLNASVNYTEMDQKTPDDVSHVVAGVMQKTCSKIKTRVIDNRSTSLPATGGTFSMKVRDRDTGEVLRKDYRLSDRELSRIIQLYSPRYISFTMKSLDDRELATCEIQEQGYSMELGGMFNTTLKDSLKQSYS